MMEDPVNNVHGKERITEMLDRRQKERQIKKEDALIKKKIDGESTEALEYFENLFGERVKCIRDSLEVLEMEQDKPKAFADLQNSILDLQKYLSASTFFLNDYRIKMCQNTIAELNHKVDSMKNIFIPKKKFGFNTKKAAKKIDKLNGDVVDKAMPQQEIRTEEMSKWTHFDKHNETILMKSEQVDEKTITAKNLTNCIFKIEGSPGTIQLSNIKNCLVFCGPVSRSVFLDNCENCKIVVACQQLRFHTSKKCDLYIHVTSRAIIEDCVEIRVSKFNYEYPSLDEDYTKSGLDRNENHWRLIDDFNWLSLDQPSPNWKILEDDQVITDWSEFIAHFEK